MYKNLFIMLFLLSCGNKIKPVPTIPIEKTQITETEKHIEKYPNGKIKIKGDLVKNKRQNLWEYFYENGTKWSEANYLNGERNGISKVFYPNGNLKFLGSYRMGKKSGIWFFYLENGKFEKEVDFGLE